MQIKNSINIIEKKISNCFEDNINCKKCYYYFDHNISYFMIYTIFYKVKNKQFKAKLI